MQTYEDQKVSVKNANLLEFQLDIKVVRAYMRSPIPMYGVDSRDVHVGVWGKGAGMQAQMRPCFLFAGTQSILQTFPGPQVSPSQSNLPLPPSFSSTSLSIPHSIPSSSLKTHSSSFLVKVKWKQKVCLPPLSPAS